MRLNKKPSFDPLTGQKDGFLVSQGHLQQKYRTHVAIQSPMSHHILFQIYPLIQRKKDLVIHQDPVLNNLLPAEPPLPDYFAKIHW